MPFPGIEKLIDDLGSFDFGKELEVIAETHTDDLADLQRQQMLEGRGVDGEYIRPYYSENPFFKKPGAAERYAIWKKKISPNSKRPQDVPNLFVDGTFHRSLFAKVTSGAFTILTDAGFGDKVFEVHKNAQGLDAEKRMEFAETITMPAITEVFAAKTTLKITPL